MEERMVVTDASAMQREIGAEGRVAVYGILFDFDKDTLRADSKPQIEVIAKRAPPALGRSRGEARAALDGTNKNAAADFSAAAFQLKVMNRTLSSAGLAATYFRAS